jgi:hypothetical protein
MRRLALLRLDRSSGTPRRAAAYVIVALSCAVSSGCVAVGTTLAGLGFSHQLSGIQYRTFTEPLPRVSRATLTAFKRMDLKLQGVQPTKTGELIKASATDRKFEVELESLTSNTTRMRALGRNSVGVIVDASTAQEIIRQAEKALEPPEATPTPAPVRAPGTKRTRSQKTASSAR